MMKKKLLLGFLLICLLALSVSGAGVDYYLSTRETDSGWSTNTQSACRGGYIKTNAGNVELLNVTKASVSGGAIAYLYAYDGDPSPTQANFTLLTSAPYTGNTANLQYILQNDTWYAICHDNSGSGYATAFKNDAGDGSVNWVNDIGWGTSLVGFNSPAGGETHRNEFREVGYRVVDLAQWGIEIEFSYTCNNPSGCVNEFIAYDYSSHTECDGDIVVTYNDALIPFESDDTNKMVYFYASGTYNVTDTGFSFYCDNDDPHTLSDDGVKMLYEDCENVSDWTLEDPVNYTIVSESNAPTGYGNNCYLTESGGSAYQQIYRSMEDSTDTGTVYGTFFVRFNEAPEIAWTNKHAFTDTTSYGGTDLGTHTGDYAGYDTAQFTVQLDVPVDTWHITKLAMRFDSTDNYDIYYNGNYVTTEDMRTSFWNGGINRFYGSFDTASPPDNGLGFDQIVASRYNVSIYPNAGDFCSPDWSCDLWGDCQIDDTRDCIQAIDNNGCGITYTGDYSEFGTDPCDYCTPDWYCVRHMNFCPANHLKNCLEIADPNNCFPTTGLPADDFDGNFTPYQEVCGYEGYNYTVDDVRAMGVDGMAIAGIELLTWVRIIYMLFTIGILVYGLGRLGIEKLFKK